MADFLRKLLKYPQNCYLVKLVFAFLCGAVQKLESQSEKIWENHPENPDEQTVQTLEGQTENEINYFSRSAQILQRCCK